MPSPRPTTTDSLTRGSPACPPRARRLRPEVRQGWIDPSCGSSRERGAHAFGPAVLPPGDPACPSMPQRTRKVASARRETDQLRTDGTPLVWYCPPSILPDPFLAVARDDLVLTGKTRLWYMITSFPASPDSQRVIHHACVSLAALHLSQPTRPEASAPDAQGLNRLISNNPKVGTSPNTCAVNALQLPSIEQRLPSEKCPHLPLTFDFEARRSGPCRTGSIVFF